MGASVWEPGSSVTANSSISVQAFTATADQTDFTLTDFSYSVGTGSLFVFASGLIQRRGTDWVEVSATAFRLLAGVPEGTVVYAFAFTEITSVLPVVGAQPADIGADNLVGVDALGLSFEGVPKTSFLAANLTKVEFDAACLDGNFLFVGDVTADVTGPADSEDSEIVLFDSTTGKLLKRATTTGILKGTSGVVSAATAGTDYAAPATASNWTASQRAAPTTDNDLSFDLTAKNNFTCTPTAGGTLTFTNIASATGQSGSILLVNGSNYAIAKHANTKCDSSFLATVSATGTYRISYYSDGTNVYCSTTGALS